MWVLVVSMSGLLRSLWSHAYRRFSMSLQPAPNRDAIGRKDDNYKWCSRSALADWGFEIVIFCTRIPTVICQNLSTPNESGQTYSVHAYQFRLRHHRSCTTSTKLFI